MGEERVALQIEAEHQNGVGVVDEPQQFGRVLELQHFDVRMAAGHRLRRRQHRGYLGPERAGELPGPDRSTGHPLADHVARAEHDEPARGHIREQRIDTEEAGHLVERRDIRRAVVAERLERLGEAGEHDMVRHLAAGLDLGALGEDRVEVVEYVVDRMHPRGTDPVDGLHLVRHRADVVGGAVAAGIEAGPAGTQQQCCAQQRRQRVVTHVLEQHAQRVAFEQENAFVGGEAAARAVVAVIAARVG